VTVKAQIVPGCFLGLHGRVDGGMGEMPPCDGELIKAHLLPRQLLRQTSEGRRAIEDPRSWVWACGGVMGNGGHHGMLDQSRRLKLHRDRLPHGVEDLAEELGLVWWLDREYGR